MSGPHDNNRCVTCGAEDDTQHTNDCLWNKEPTVVFYAVRNTKGEYYGTSSALKRGWQPNISDAKVYSKPGPAKTLITTLAIKEETTPDLVELVVTKVNVINQTKRVAVAKKKRAEASERRELSTYAARVRRAQEEFDAAQARLRKLRMG